MRRLAAFVAIAVFALALPLQAAAAPCAGFTDVDDADPFCANVAWIKNRNITLGCAVGLYCPNDAVTRLAMAALLNRLGDVVLPPNVIWVAPVGGMFQSIQAAIDYAASLSPPGPRLVRVAPGTYDEAIQMAPLVDVEGSGEGMTEITSAFCTAGPPQAGTVTGATLAQLRHVTVRNRGSATGSNQCAAVYLGSAYGTPLRHVRVVSDFSQAAVFGIRMTVTPSVLGTVVLENVVMDMAQAASSAIGISATGGANGSYILRDIQAASATMGNAFAIQLINANASLERVVAAAYGRPQRPAGGGRCIDRAGSAFGVARAASLVRDEHRRGGNAAHRFLAAGGCIVRRSNVLSDLRPDARAGRLLS
jgi:hypothetical protein